MTSESVPLFRRANVVKKVSQDTVVTTSHPTVAPQPCSSSGKRPAAETCPYLFSKRHKSISHKRPRFEILDLIEDPLISIPPEWEVPRESSSLNPSISRLLPEEDVDSAPKLEQIRKDYDAIRDPLEIHGAVARHLIKALNASHALACRTDLLGDARAEACEKERALQFQVIHPSYEGEETSDRSNLSGNQEA
ncbi:hypothetical protein LIER_07714 [Lithospermum erythrorhizon]|uniref:Uncharacterized protein n=1 Tax=Lithospermum erythrorhizon TaxID=34254 RepID=A0AAV3PA55_LITER